MRKFVVGLLLMTLAAALTSMTTASSAAAPKTCDDHTPWYTHKKVNLGKRIAFHTPWQEGGKISVKKSNSATTKVREMEGTSHGAAVGADFKGISVSFNVSHSDEAEITRSATTKVTVGHAYRIKKGVKARIVVQHRYTMMKTFKKHKIYPCETVTIYWTKLKCPRRKIHAVYRLQCARGGFGWCERG